MRSTGPQHSPRQAAVAGRFYPDAPAHLRGLVAGLLTEPEMRSARAVVAPHAGYPFSGRTAGRVFSSIRVPNRVVVLGPNHTGHGARVSVWPGGAWETPLGPVPIDDELTAALLAEDAVFVADRRAHAFEHAIEVELPFLLMRNPDLRLTAITLAHLDLDTTLRVGRALARVIGASDDPVLLVASSDMSHFIPADEAERLDRLAFDAIEALSPTNLYRVVHKHRISMCGVIPTTAVLEAICQLGPEEAELIDYTNSGEVTRDFSSVVAYAGLIIS